MAQTGDGGEPAPTAPPEHVGNQALHRFLLSPILLAGTPARSEAFFNISRSSERLDMRPCAGQPVLPVGTASLRGSGGQFEGLEACIRNAHCANTRRRVVRRATLSRTPVARSSPRLPCPLGNLRANASDSRAWMPQMASRAFHDGGHCNRTTRARAGIGPGRDGTEP